MIVRRLHIVRFDVTTKVYAAQLLVPHKPPPLGHARSVGCFARAYRMKVCVIKSTATSSRLVTLGCGIFILVFSKGMDVSSESSGRR